MVGYPGVFGQALRRTVSQWPRLFATHIIFTVLGAVALWPFFALVTRGAVGLSGQAALADLDIASFLLSPVGFGALLLMAALLVSILVFEAAAMMAIDLDGRKGRRKGSRAALRFVAWKALTILRFGFNLAGRAVLIAAPALAVMALIAFSLLREHDINYYLSAQPPAFWIAAGLAGLAGLVAGGFLLLRLFQWSLALPLALFAGIAPRNSFARSRQAVSSHFRVIAVTLAAWALASLALNTVVAAGLYMLAGLIIPEAPESVTLLALALGTVTILFLVAGLFVQTFVNGTLALSLVGLMERTDSADFSIAAVEKLPESRRAGGRLWKRALIAAAAFGLAVLAAGALMLKDVSLSDEVEVIAHRAGAGHAPENTMAAVERAIEDGADWIEIDVQEAADGTVVVIHDRDLMRVGRKPVQVHALTQADMRAIDIGSWFAPEFASERLPALDEVLEVSRGRVKVLIELKYYGFQVALEQSVVEIVERAGMEDQIAIMSLDQQGIARMAALRPQWPIGLLTARALGDLTRLGADFLAVNAAIASSRLVVRAHRAGQQIQVWTINDEASMSEFISLGVDGLITDEPALAREVLEQRAELGPAGRLMLMAGARLGLTR